LAIWSTIVGGIGFPRGTSSTEKES
jgi:hypothetical protein